MLIMSFQNKIISAILAIAVFTAILFFILDEDEFEEFWMTILGLVVLLVIGLIGWANANTPVDRSRRTIDWELEQEQQEKDNS